MYFKKRKKVFFILVISALSFSAYTQTSINTADITGFGKQALEEKIFVHTDKDFYITGEILWFKLYDVSADSLKPLNLSNVAYVEILNANQKPVLQATVALNNGGGNGSFYLPSSINSGNYIFRAYTNWMKNFGADKYFQKQITVVNTLTQVAKKVNNDSDNYAIGFFPEGGNLVANLESKVAFKVTDKYGNGVNCSGNIVDENNRDIASFSTLKFGMGSFYFKAEQGHTYNAVLNINGTTITKALPAAYDRGYVMHLSVSDRSQVSITVSSNENSAQNIYLLAWNNNGIITGLMQAIADNSKATFTLNKSNLPAGILHFTVFNSNKQPVCERTVFSKPQPLQLSLTSDTDLYGTRSEVKLEVAATGRADLSMAVYLLDSLQTPGDNNILSYLWLTSELKGNIESPQYYFSNAGNEVDSALENLLLTQGWSRFKLNDNAKDAQPLFRFAPEREGHIIEGRVTDKNSGSPAANVRVYLSVPGQHFRFATSVSNDSGKVIFDIKDFYGSGELVVQTAKEDSMYRVDIADPFSNQLSGWRVNDYAINENAMQQLTQHNLAMQVQNAYMLSKLNSFISPSIDSTAFYGKPDATYYLDNYVRFNTMEEVLREYIVGVGVRLRQGNYSLTTVDPRNHLLFEDNPLVLVDGVPVFDMNKLIAYNPLKIKKADVLTRKYYINTYTAHGILSYSTYKGDLDGFQFDPGTIELSYDGLQLEREFYSPQYATAGEKQSRLPDYRNVLYWAPQVVANNMAHLSFYTSDLKGKYIAVIQGIGANGQPGYSTKVFEVK